MSIFVENFMFLIITFFISKDIRTRPYHKIAHTNSRDSYQKIPETLEKIVHHLIIQILKVHNFFSLEQLKDS